MEPQSVEHEHDEGYTDVSAPLGVQHFARCEIGPSAPHDTRPAPALFGEGSDLPNWWASEAPSGTYTKGTPADLDDDAIHSLVHFLQDEVAIAEQLLREHRLERQEAAKREAELLVRAVRAEKRARDAEQAMQEAQRRAEIAELRVQQLRDEQITSAHTTANA